MYGPGGEGAHAAVEWVSIADTVTVHAYAHRGGGAILRVRALVNPAETGRACPPRRATPRRSTPRSPGTRRRRCATCRGRGGARAAAVLVKDESDRLGLPAFKVLGASWAVERALREARDAHAGRRQRGQPRPRRRPRRRAARAALPDLPAGTRRAGAAAGDRRRGRGGRRGRRRLRGRGGPRGRGGRGARACSRSPTSARRRPAVGHRRLRDAVSRGRDAGRLDLVARPGRRRLARRGGGARRRRHGRHRR